MSEYASPGSPRDSRLASCWGDDRIRVLCLLFLPREFHGQASMHVSSISSNISFHIHWHDMITISFPKFLGWTCRYGKVFKSHLFGSPVIISTDPDVSKFVLQSGSEVFVPFYPASLTELVGKSSILLITGSLQRRVHGLIGAFFKSPSLKAQITADMQKYLQGLMASWKDGQLVYIQDVTKYVSFDFSIQEQ